MHLALSVHSLNSHSCYPIHTLRASLGGLAGGRQDRHAMHELTPELLIDNEEGMDRMWCCSPILVRTPLTPLFSEIFRAVHTITRFIPSRKPPVSSDSSDSKVGSCRREPARHAARPKPPGQSAQDYAPASDSRRPPIYPLES